MALMGAIGRGAGALGRGAVGGIAGGANQEGYWIASVEKPTEWYFMPLTHFERDYIIL